MKMVRILVQLPELLETKFDAKRKRGTSVAGLIRHLLGSSSKTRRPAGAGSRNWPLAVQENTCSSSEPL